jgi:DNA-binding ferritin-like protein (Dps family)
MLIDKIVGDLADKKSYREYRARVKRLPVGYREAAKALERYLMYMGPSDDSKALIAMLDDLAELFDQSVADGTPLRALLGDNPSEFAEEFLQNYAGGSWIRAERARLAESIERAVEAQGTVS